MENDQRLTPLPVTHGLQTSGIDVSLPYPGSYDDTLDSKRSIRQYFNVVYKRLPLIIAITVLVTAASALYSYRQPSIYSATTGMIINPRKAPQTQKESININLGDDPRYYNTQLQLLQNQDLMKRVVIALGLQRDANLFNLQDRGIIAGMRSLFTGGQKPAAADDQLPIVGDSSASTEEKGALVQLTPEEAARAESYAGALVGGLRVEQVEKTNIVNISIQSVNPALAARVADKVAELFVKEDAERETSGAEKAFEDLNKSIEELKATVIQEEDDYVAEMRSSNLPLMEKGGDLRASDLGALLTQWRDAQNELSKLQTTYSAAVAASGKGDILSVVGDNKAIQDARSQNLVRQAGLEKRMEEMETRINVAKEERERLLVRYTPQYKDVVAKDAQIRELEAQKEKIYREVSGKVQAQGLITEKNAEREVIASLSSSLAAAQARESRQRALFEQASSQANIEGVAETKLTGLKRQIESNRGLLDTYIQRQKEQELGLATGRPDNIQIQNHAVTPTSPIGPQRNRNILLAFLLSFGAGVGLAFLLDYLDDSVRTSDDISRHLGLPTLALIPHHLTTEKRSLLASKNGTNGSSVSSTALITMDDRHSPVAEAYRHLRTSLLFSSAGKPPQTILVTSSQPAEGKTTTAINTAITLAQSGADVVIVDCDLRRPRLHTHFSLENTQGLTNYLSGDKDTENLLRTYEDLPKLKVITSGPIPPNPAELLSSNEMRNLLTFLSGRFKHVIIDSPPAISFTDAAILSTLVDGVVLVAMANKSSIHLMRQFKQRVGAIGARIYGVVLNGLKENSQDYYYYYGSGYDKYYSQADDDDSTPIMDA
ncbi:MAG TPA: polysaccharide biosynthesis tyrosine autokinase [Pyrinomonadaceae bacterium]|jgi:capsular exopolysaccharide synthesis family protein|nr:polysaccharide biosynthesis tyrosine autokinase [Pyrinomonadaceae bacterium]